MRPISYLSLLLLFLFSCASSKNKSQGIKNTKALVTQMAAKSASNWVQAFTFVQSTYRHKKDGTIDTSTWYEAVAYPDKFRIDFGDLSEGNAVIYRQDSAYQFKNKDLVSARKEVNDLLLLTGAVQAYSVDTTMARLARSGVSVELFRTDVFMGKPCYVIGKRLAEKPKSKEVWIEQNRLLVLRQLESAKEGKLLEIQFDEYTKVQDSWIEQWVTIRYDNKIVQTERYNEITPRNNLSADVFNPSLFGKIHWYDSPVSPKVTFDVSKIDKDGLSGPNDGKVSVDYEFCIPKENDLSEAVKRIDPSLKVLQKGRGRIGCTKKQWLCMGNTHQENWRSILDQLAELTYVEQIDQTFFE